MAWSANFPGASMEAWPAAAGELATGSAGGGVSTFTSRLEVFGGGEVCRAGAARFPTGAGLDRAPCFWVAMN